MCVLTFLAHHCSSNNRPISPFVLVNFRKARSHTQMFRAAGKDATTKRICQPMSNLNKTINTKIDINQQSLVCLSVCPSVCLSDEHDVMSLICGDKRLLQRHVTKPTARANQRQHVNRNVPTQCAHMDSSHYTVPSRITLVTLSAPINKHGQATSRQTKKL